MIMSGKPRKAHAQQDSLAFQELFVDYPDIPPLNTFIARDGRKLPYRHYPGPSNKILILLHGSGWHSQYLMPLARFISGDGLAQVYTPDLRGHGLNPERRGDVDYIGQLEDDLADFIALILKDNPGGMLILGGHSLGGGLAIRFAGSQYRCLVDAYLLLSPFLKYNAPTMRPNAGGWARPHIRPIIGLTMLNNVGIRWLNDLPVIDFNMPEEARDGTETLSYSYRLNTSYAPRNYKKDLRAITQPLFVAAGTEDEAFFSDRFEPVVSGFATAEVRLLEGVSHMGVVVSPAVHPAVREWMQGLDRA
jgi:alpha-beta hydrolase superfamily lysophospholipase